MLTSLYGQVGAGAFVRYSKVCFIGRFHRINVHLIIYMVKDCLTDEWYNDIVDRENFRLKNILSLKFSSCLIFADRGH